VPLILAGAAHRCDRWSSSLVSPPQLALPCNNAAGGHDAEKRGPLHARPRTDRVGAAGTLEAGVVPFRGASPLAEAGGRPVRRSQGASRAEEPAGAADPEGAAREVTGSGLNASRWFASSWRTTMPFFGQVYAASAAIRRIRDVPVDRRPARPALAPVPRRPFPTRGPAGLLRLLVQPRPRRRRRRFT
jgi:hypothetical protein